MSDMISDGPKRICLYHGIDLDGFCSGAIYKKYMDEKGYKCELIPVNYGWELPWEKFEGAEVTIIDFSIQPWEEFSRLLDCAKKVIWIDHHKSAGEEFERNWQWASSSSCSSSSVPVERVICFSIESTNLDIMFDTRQAGCELAWNYFFPEQTMPEAVRLLGRYDVWDHEDSKVVPFQYGMRVQDMRPDVGDDRGGWEDYLDSSRIVLVNETIIDGELIFAYQREEDEIGARSFCFELDWEGHRWLAANRVGRGSQFFESLFDSEKHEGMLSFGWNGGRKEWVFGLYAIKGGIDCSEIAKRYGGGGHQGAAGFRVAKLPFDLFESIKVE